MTLMDYDFFDLLWYTWWMHDFNHSPSHNQW